MPNYSTGKIAILLGTGGGGFAAPSFIEAGTYPGNVASGDFNGDGKLDLVMTSGENNNGAVFPGDGKGGFGAPLRFMTGAYPASLVVKDFNGDGKADLAIGNYSDDTVQVLTGNGQGGLTESISALVGTGAHPLGLIAVDFNHNGRSDLAFANGGSDTVGVSFNSCATTPAPEIATVVAASYQGLRVSSESIAAAFGTGLATEVREAGTLPLPTNLAGTRVLLRDSKGVERLAPLFFVSPNQVNYQVPPGMAQGLATVMITNGAGETRSSRIVIGKVAPGLFTADASGTGLPAAVALRVSANGQQGFDAVADYDQSRQRFIARPVTVTNSGEDVYLILFGTGIQSRTSLAKVKALVGGLPVEVIYAGPQGSLIGLDQVNLRLPKELAGQGEVEIELFVDGFAANRVRVSIR